MSRKIQEQKISRWETIACPVCGGQTFEKLFEKQGEPFVRCTECGLVLINPRPQYDDIAKTYDAGYSQGYVSKQAGKRRRAARMVARIKRMKKTGRWLDVGCSAGFIVEAARNAGFDAYGVDIEAWGIRFAKEQLGLDHVYQGALEEQHFPDGHFDIITAYEIIEHVPNLDRFVGEIKRILAPDGILEIRTPDVGHWRTPRKLETWDAILPSEHLYYFDRRTLPRLLEKHGLTVLKRGFNLKPGLRLYVGHARN